MKYWIVPSNNSTFCIGDAIKEQNGLVDWRQSNNFAVGDIVFIYLSKPDCCIKYKMEVVKVKIDEDIHFDQEQFWKDKEVYYSGLGAYLYVRFKLNETYPDELFSLRHMREHGLKGSLQGVQECPNVLLDFLLNPSSSVEDDYDVDYPEDDEALYEGSLIKVMANKYERNRDARKKCIEIKGAKCAVCGFDFVEMYGEVGKGFIHVHHVVPISSIGKTYKLDIIKDLVPVCPNCHYMLHRKNPPYEIVELKKQWEENNYGSALAAEPLPQYDSLANVIVGVVKNDNVEPFLHGNAKLYYFGKRFPSKYNIKNIDYFAPYFNGGIRGYYDVSTVRYARKNEIVQSVEFEDDSSRIVLELSSYHHISDTPQKISLANYNYAFISLNKIVKVN